MNNKKTIAAATFLILSGLTIWGGSNINSIPSAPWDNSGCPYPKCGQLQITLPPFNPNYIQTVFVTNPVATTKATITPFSPTYVSSPTKIPTLPNVNTVTVIPTISIGATLEAANTPTVQFNPTAYAIGLTQTSVARSGTGTSTPNSNSTAAPTSTPIPTLTQVPTTIIGTPTPTPVLSGYNYNGDNTWVDFFPKVGTTSLKHYDIINGLGGHVDRVTTIGDFAGARFIKYIYSDTNVTFECERWTLGDTGLPFAIVHHNYGSADCNSTRNKFPTLGSIPTGTGVKYPVLYRGQQSAQQLAYDPQGNPEYTTLIEMNKTIAYMKNVLAPISSGGKMLDECLVLAVSCHVVLQVYHYSTHIGVEEVIYINGMPYSGGAAGSADYAKYLRNGELAWSKYRVIGNPSQFPHPTDPNYISAITAIAEPNMFKGEFYIYDGEYKVDGVEYLDPTNDNNPSLRVQICNTSYTDSWGSVVNHPTANFGLDVYIRSNSGACNIPQTVCFYNDNYMALNAQLWYKKYGDSIDDVICTKEGSNTLSCVMNSVSSSNPAVHFGVFYNTPLNSAYFANKPIVKYLADGSNQTCTSAAPSIPNNPPATNTPTLDTATPVSTQVSTPVSTSTPDPFLCSSDTVMNKDAGVGSNSMTLYETSTCRTPRVYCIKARLPPLVSGWLDVYSYQHVSPVNYGSSVYASCSEIDAERWQCTIPYNSDELTLIRFNGNITPSFTNWQPSEVLEGACS